MSGNNRDGRRPIESGTRSGSECSGSARPKKRATDPHRPPTVPSLPAVVHRRRAEHQLSIHCFWLVPFGVLAASDQTRAALQACRDPQTPQGA